MTSYIGRFAPSPTGPLHAGSLVAALASYLDARVHGGQWLVRIEDVDEGRAVPGVAEGMLDLLAKLGMHWDGEVLWQSRRGAHYARAAERLGAHAYACGCNRREIADSRIGIASDGAAIYPGTCRHGLPPGKVMRALRLRVPDPDQPDGIIRFQDRCAGAVSQVLAREVGDFVLRRADGFWAYQLAVVVDDAEQGVSDVVRGADLLDSTARQIYLQHLLGYSVPRYLHLPVVRNANGEKLSKQTGAMAVTADNPAQVLAVLQQAAQFLALATQSAPDLDQFWVQALASWDQRFGPGAARPDGVPARP